MCLFMNVIIARQIFSPHLINPFQVQLSSEYFVLKQEFKPKYAWNYVIVIEKS